ncbi:hypothetical protein G7Y89_g12099 [Cudoniella acicularis]|uniref:Uncharacterized protein n=1 Tax=Cudoniella acicularis TaxID=354080 RepID=A0A8H4R9N8_9HELO|nr:hypothetical protein G7Y89_g12099 [Cudoniella acicularis]
MPSQDCADGTQLVPTPNYVQAPNKVYFNFFKNWIAKDRAYGYLCHRLSANGATITPDWTDIAHGLPVLLLSCLIFKDRVRSLYLYSNFALLKHYGGSPSDGHNFPSLSLSGIRAFVFFGDTIQSTSTPWKDPGCTIPKAENVPAISQRTEADVPKAWDIIKAISHTCMHFGGDPVYTPDCFMSLYSQSKWKPVDQPQTLKEEFFNWLHANKDFWCRGKTVRALIEEHCQSPIYKRRERINTLIPSAFKA